VQTTVRRASADDGAFLQQMLGLALAWRPGAAVPTHAEVMARADMARYVQDWRRHGDVGVVAEVDDRPVGAAWLRFFTADDHGYGYLDDETPELSIAVLDGARGRGHGSVLLRSLLRDAQSAAIQRVSLSVEFDNPSRHLYRRLGFAVVGHFGGAHTMVLDLGRAPLDPPTLSRVAG
jgi:ribosomal protein S18 acetylase RimI-like enzyme